MKTKFKVEPGLLEAAEAYLTGGSAAPSQYTGSASSGDIVRTRGGHHWVFFLGVMMEGIQHAFLFRPDRHGDIIYTLQPVHELTELDNGTTKFERGQRILYEGDNMVVHRDTGLIVFLRDSDGRLTSCWRWELGLLSMLSKPFSIMCADHRQAEEHEV